VLLEDAQPLVLGALDAGQLGVPLHPGDRHAGVAQAPQRPQPIHVVVGEGAASARRPADVREEPDAFVVAERVDAETGLLGHLAGGVGHVIHLCASNHSAPCPHNR
jgi:hypothetical protein